MKWVMEDDVQEREDLCLGLEGIRKWVSARF